MKNILFLFCFILSVVKVHSQQIELLGNQNTIATDGTNSPQSTDGTLMAATPISESSSQVFTILNLEDKDIVVSDISSNSDQFSISGKIKKIKKNSSDDFVLTFSPDSQGSQSALITIVVKYRGLVMNYFFNVQASGIEGGAYSGIMISQYYEHLQDDYIEIKNMSLGSTSKKPYVLAKYEPTDDLNKAPGKGNFLDISSMNPGEVRVYDKFSLKGNEIIVLSKSHGKNCYKDRIDILGNHDGYWGENLSLSKGACASESAHTEFVAEDWITLSHSEVDDAEATQNLFLGTYQDGSIVWLGESWTDDALPDRTRSAIIDAPYDGDLGSIEACDLTVNDDVNFDKNSKNSIVVYGDLNIYQGELKIGDEESLVMYDDQALINGIIRKNESSTFRNNSYDMTYWSSPVEEAEISKVFSGVNPGRIYYFDQQKTNTSDREDPDFWSTWVLADGQMHQAKGYAAEGVQGTTGVHEISFEGKPNNGLIVESVVHHNDSDLNNDFNLIGNPYPSAIDIELFFDVNKEVIDPTVYLWTHTSPVSSSTGDFSFDDYATYNYTGGTSVGSGPAPTRNIGSAQGFFIRAIQQGEVSFRNAMRIKGSNDQFYKNSEIKNQQDLSKKDRVWLNMTTDQGGFNQLLIGFVEGATDEIDPGYDAAKFQGSNKISFYSVVNGSKMVIQGLNSFEENKKLTLGFDSEVSQRTFSISVAKAEGALRKADLILFDRDLQVSHNLKTSPYTFEQRSKGSFKERFSLTFIRPVETVEAPSPELGQLKVFNRGDVFTVTSAVSMETVRLYNIQGQMIHEVHPGAKSCEITSSNEQKGTILLLEVIHRDHPGVVKKVYKH